MDSRPPPLSASSPSPSPSPLATSDSGSSASTRLPLALLALSVRAVPADQRPATAAGTRNALTVRHPSPAAIIAVDGHPHVKTAIRANTLNCSWDLSCASDLQAVIGGYTPDGKGSMDSMPGVPTPVLSLTPPSHNTAAVTPSSSYSSSYSFHSPHTPTSGSSFPCFSSCPFSSTRFLICLEDFARHGPEDLGEGDDMGVARVDVASLMERAWKKQLAQQTGGKDLKLNGTTTGTLPTARTGDLTTRSVMPLDEETEALFNSVSDAVSSSLSVEQGWYPVHVTAPLTDRVFGRHRGEVSLLCALNLQSFLKESLLNRAPGTMRLITEMTMQLLDGEKDEKTRPKSAAVRPATSHGNLDKLITTSVGSPPSPAELLAAASAPPVTSTRPTSTPPACPLITLLSDHSTLSSLVELVWEAACDKGSMDGERMVQRIWTLIHRAIDWFGEEKMVPLFFANDSALLCSLFRLRLCGGGAGSSSGGIDALSPCAANTRGWNLYTSGWEQFILLVARLASVREPRPKPSADELAQMEAELKEAEEATRKQAEKDAQRKAKAKKKGVSIGEDEVLGSRPSSSRASSRPASRAGSAKKKKATTPELPIAPSESLPPSSLNYGLLPSPSSSSSTATSDSSSSSPSASSSLILLCELLRSIRLHLQGFKLSNDIVWSSMSRVHDFVGCLQLLRGMSIVLQRWGGVTASQRLKLAEEARPLFSSAKEHIEHSNADAVWLAKQVALATKKSRDTIDRAAESMQDFDEDGGGGGGGGVKESINARSLAKRLAGEVEAFQRMYPPEVKPKKEKK